MINSGLKEGVSLSLPPGRKNINVILKILDTTYGIPEAFLKALEECMEFANDEMKKEYDNFISIKLEREQIEKDMNDYRQNLVFFDSFETEQMRKRKFELDKKFEKSKIVMKTFLNVVLTKSEVLRDKISRQLVDELPMEYSPRRRSRYEASEYTG